MSLSRSYSEPIGMFFVVSASFSLSEVEVDGISTLPEVSSVGFLAAYIPEGTAVTFGYAFLSGVIHVRPPSSCSPTGKSVARLRVLHKLLRPAGLAGSDCRRLWERSCRLFVMTESSSSKWQPRSRSDEAPSVRAETLENLYHERDN
jgi:hypothetical protein